MTDIEQQVAEILERNKRVEADKAWETSKTRKALIIMITYFIACLVMWAIGVKKPYIDAIIPTTGFYLSTLSVGWVKGFWFKRVYK